GQRVIRLAAGAVADLGDRVIYGDTDALFVDLGEPGAARAAARGEGLRAAIGGAVGDAVARDFGCTSRLELEFEKVYARFFMPEVRGGAMGSKKRYAGLVVGESGEEIELVGLEAVRRDWSGVARRFQRALLDVVFNCRPVADFIRGCVADRRGGSSGCSREVRVLEYARGPLQPLGSFRSSGSRVRRPCVLPPHSTRRRRRPHPSPRRMTLSP